MFNYHKEKQDQWTIFKGTKSGSLPSSLLLFVPFQKSIQTCKNNVEALPKNFWLSEHKTELIINTRFKFSYIFP